MKDKAALFAVTLLASGCVSNEVIRQKNTAYQKTIPSCHSSRECDAKWSAAKRWVINNTGYKLQHSSDDYLETYNSRDMRLSARVTKEPIPDGSGYRIVIMTWCYNAFGCAPDKWDAAIAFNKEVGATKVPSF